MTLPTPPVEAACVICGATSRHAYLQSTNAFGPPDLDTRPPEMERSTMDYWVQQCPGCGYCASHISTDLTVSKADVESASYQEQLRDPRYPDLANAFLCMSMLEESIAAFTRSAWSAIHAAWVCDDHDRVEAATTCRRRALRLREEGLRIGQNLSEQDGADIAIAADLLRRTQDHDAVAELVSNRLDDIPDELIGKILQFQVSLASREDSRCYTMEDVPAGENQA